MTSYPNVAGIYKLTCIYNGKVYIGKAINLNKRLNSHRYCERRSKGRCYFENVIIKYGWNSFVVEIIETFENFDKTKDNKFLLEKEAYYIGVFESTNKDIGYNICTYSQDRTGLVHSDDTKEKMSKAKLGKPLSDHHKEAIKNKMSTEENREKMRNYNLGKTHSEESKEKMRQPRSKEARENIRKSRMGKKHTEESKEKNRQSNLGKKRSDETKLKMRLAKLGKPFSQEHKDKLRESKRKTNIVIPVIKIDL